MSLFFHEQFRLGPKDFLNLLLEHPLSLYPILYQNYSLRSIQIVLRYLQPPISFLEITNSFFRSLPPRNQRLLYFCSLHHINLYLVMNFRNQLLISKCLCLDILAHPMGKVNFYSH